MTEYDMCQQGINYTHNLLCNTGQNIKIFLATSNGMLCYLL